MTHSSIISHLMLCIKHIKVRVTYKSILIVTLHPNQKKNK